MDLGEIARERWERRSCGRLFHGVSEGQPGITIDRYGEVCLVQTWTEPLTPEAIAAMELPGTPVYVSRGPDRSWSGPEENHIFEELGLRYRFQTPRAGQDPVLFLDFRCGRRWLKEHAQGRVLNTFAYSCSAGLAAASNGARVVNLDHGRSALEQGENHAELNSLKMRFLREDFYCAVRQFAGMGVRNKKGMKRYNQQKFDLVILDPPTFAKGPYGAIDIVRDYSSLAKPCVLVLEKGGKLLATNHHASVDYDDWVGQVTRCAEKAGRPVVDVERLEVEDDFPSFDGNPPLKVAVFSV